MREGEEELERPGAALIWPAIAAGLSMEMEDRADCMAPAICRIGSVETFMLAAAGQQGWSFLLAGYILPAFIGNATGGVTFVALLNHAQVVAGSSEESQA